MKIRENAAGRVALYARVSTGEQDPELQVRELRAYVERRGWTADEFIDHGFSGAKESRPELDRLMRELRRRRYGSLVVWKFDRAARSLRHLVLLLDELRTLDVGFISITEAIDTTTVTGRAMFGMVAVFAEYEREVLRERVRAGLATARAQGKTLGRPRRHVDESRVLELRSRGRSLRSIGDELGVGKRVVARVLAERPENPSREARSDPA